MHVTRYDLLNAIEKPNRPETRESTAYFIWNAKANTNTNVNINNNIYKSQYVNCFSFRMFMEFRHTHNTTTVHIGHKFWWICNVIIYLAIKCFFLLYIHLKIKYDMMNNNTQKCNLSTTLRCYACTAVYIIVHQHGTFENGIYCGHFPLTVFAI